MLLLLFSFSILTTFSFFFIKKNIEKKILGSFFIIFAISIILWFQYDTNFYEYQFIYTWTSLNFNHYKIGIDSLSLFFIILTIFIIIISILISWSSIKKNIKYFLITFLILENVLVGVFIVLDIFFFYITFETC